MLFKELGASHQKHNYNFNTSAEENANAITRLPFDIENWHETKCYFHSSRQSKPFREYKCATLESPISKENKFNLRITQQKILKINLEFQIAMK